ncbi:MAG: succinate dehydrogenase, hydrophobic membrane anchor protein [Alphaproteobacteria bacterium]|nr:succinate dehydrogenase, hydrophobic membrane anchor protein [Alphaproteobacteria bacterium]
MEFRTSAKAVRGLGSAREGAAHWWAQRMTALALVPLSVWFAVSVIRLAGAEHGALTEWLASPFNAVAMLLFTLAGFHHAALGLQVVLEDYVSHEGRRVAAIVAVKGACWALAAACAFATLKIAFGG